MNNSKHIRILSAAGAAVALAGIAAGTGSAQEQPTTIDLVQRSGETRTAFVDAPPRRREGPGDQFSVSGPVRDASGRRSGRSDATFVQTSAKHAQGSATFTLPRGTIVVAGALDDRSTRDRSDRLAIVGGTGAYAGASGIIDLTYERRVTRFRLTLAP